MDVPSGFPSGYSPREMTLRSEETRLKRQGTPSPQGGEMSHYVVKRLIPDELKPKDLRPSYQGNGAAIFTKRL
jgi:hypothetical protein